MSTNGIIVTIDGPAGSGKSTVAKKLASRLEMDYLDTGGMYRAAALLGLRKGVDWTNPNELTDWVKKHDIDGYNEHTWLDGEDVSNAIRSQETTLHTKYAADNPDIRELMVQKQREIAKSRDIVTEGRDQGSVVFPDALCKFYLTASPEERARRRMNDSKGNSESVEYQTLLNQINMRDEQDRNRSVGPLTVPKDAVYIDSEGMTVDQVVDAMEAEVKKRKLALGKL